MNARLRKNKLKSIATGQQVFTNKTPKNDLLNLIKSLRPIATNIPIIRMGPIADGGYLVPDDLKEISACFSPGVDKVSDFELDCADRGMQVYMADYSVDGPATSHPKFHFIKKYVGCYSADDYITVDDWVNNTIATSDNKDLLLQIDIEGGEYECFFNMSPTLLSRFRIIVAEFHNLDLLWSAPFFSIASRAFRRLLLTHYCVHIHPNNYVPYIPQGDIEIPPVMEFTFIRKDRVAKLSPIGDYPHPLDVDNSKLAPMSLPKIWYKD